MKLLVTGAFNATDEQLDKLSELGYEIMRQQDERGKPECDFSDADAVICNGLFLYHDISEFKSLKVIQLTSAGLDRVPLEEIRKRNIALFNARGVYSVPMAEFALAGVLNLYKHLNSFYENQKQHLWQKDRQLSELCGKTVAIVGCGSVGTECAKRFKAFDTKIISVDVFNHCNKIYDEFCHISNIGSVLGEADIVILTLPLTDKTRGLFNGGMFSQFKDGSVLVNISRGAVVNEADLAAVLESGKLSGAVLDVFETEPLDGESPLWDMPNVIISPHNSFVSGNNGARLFALAYDNLKKSAKGLV
jgi:phosphoglycerate dehydrogenase-like enzyme